jgi:DNA-binding MarR family transcriptional regulator
MPARTGLSKKAPSRRSYDLELTELEVEILCVTRELGTTAVDSAIMAAVSARKRATYHKQNFRRVIESLERRGYLVRYPCRIRTGGRTAERRFELSDEGVAVLQLCRGRYLALAERIAKIL